MPPDAAEQRGRLVDIIQVMNTKGVERALKRCRRSEWGAVGDELVAAMADDSEAAFVAALHAKCAALGMEKPQAPVAFDFTYVRVPADDGAEIEELTATARGWGDQLASDLLASAFAGGRVTNTHGLRAEHGSGVVDEKLAALNLAAAKGTVEVFALQRPSPSTRPVAHTGVYVYLDEMGLLKELPVNARATGIARSCGLEVESPFHGDVFIGRVVVSPSPSRNCDFRAAELASSSTWLLSVPEENHRYQLAMASYEAAAKEKQVNAVSAADEDERGWRWAQTAEDVEVTIAIPAGTRSRDLAVAFGAASLKVTLKASTSNPETELVRFALYGKVRTDDCTWTVGADERGSHVQVTMEKVEEVTWPAFEAAPSDGGGGGTK